MADVIETINDQCVAGRSDGEVFFVLAPRKELTRAEAIRHAAWLVALADPNREQFDKVLEAILST